MINIIIRLASIMLLSICLTTFLLVFDREVFNQIVGISIVPHCAPFNIVVNYNLFMAQFQSNSSKHT